MEIQGGSHDGDPRRVTRWSETKRVKVSVASFHGNGAPAILKKAGILVFYTKAESRELCGR